MTSQWWEAPPPKPKKQRDWGNAAASAGIGAAAGAGAMGGALMLMSRGKVKPKTKVITRTKVKVKRVKDPKNPAPKPPSFRPQAASSTPPKAGGPAPAEPGKEAVATAPITGRRSTPDNPVGPNVPKSTAEQAARGVQGGQVRANQARVLRRKAAADKSKVDNLPGDRIGREPIADLMQPGEKTVRNTSGLKVSDKATIKEVDAAYPDVDRPGVGPVPQRPSAKAKRQTRRAADNNIFKKRLEFEVEEEIAIYKAWKGEKGDKRNTKYAVAGGLGYIVGVQSGMRLGARSAGTTFHANRDEVVRRMTNYTTKQQKKLKKKGLPVPTKNPSVAQGAANLGVKGRHGGFGTEKVKPASEWTPKMREINRINNSVKGSRELVRGGAIGAAAGTATGLGLMAAYRANKRKKQQVMV